MIPRAKGDERGAVLVFTAVLLLVLIGFAALAVDLGNAWSNSRLTQTTADVAAPAAVLEVTRTFRSSPSGGPGPYLEDEVQNEAEALVAANVDPGTSYVVSTSTAFTSTGADVTVAVSLDSENSFGAALGAENITVDATATAHIEVGVTDKLLPIGFERPIGQPYQCLDIGVPDGGGRPIVCEAAGGEHNALLAMASVDPAPCSGLSIVPNFKEGVDHLVDLIDTGVRTESDACTYGHLLSLPTQANTATPDLITLTEAAIGAGAPLASNLVPLWQYLDPDNPSGIDECDPAGYSDPSLDAKSNRLRTCLQSWTSGQPPIFVPGVTSSPRFGWGIEIHDDGEGVPSSPHEFEGGILLFLNTIVSDIPGGAGGQALSAADPAWPGGNVAGVTVYSIQEGMLSNADRLGLSSPFGVDSLEFSLTG